MLKRGIIFNEDGDHFLNTRLKTDMGREVDEETLLAFIDQYKNTDITDLFLCVSAMMSSFPSKEKTFYGDKYLVKEEMGKAVDYSGTVCEVAYHIWVENGLDMYGIWIRRCRENGIAPWLSFRLNDAHIQFDVPNFLVPKEYYEHFEENSRVRHRRQMQYFDRCRDFELPKVREEWLAHIEEALERYDVEGIELDLQRELWCFRIGRERAGAQVMTEFIGAVKALLKRYESRVGHRIQLAVRAHPNPVTCCEFGFDILEWAKRGYLDLYIAAPRWATSDNDMPIRLWKQMLEPYGVPVAGGAEILLGASPKPTGNPPKVMRAVNTVETAFGTAANILEQGADKLYLFNYMSFEQEMITPQTRRDTKENDLFKPEGMLHFLANAGDTERIAHVPRRYILTYTDTASLGHEKSAQLPRTLAGTAAGMPGEPMFLRIAAGGIGETDEVTLNLGIEGVSEGEDGWNAGDALRVYVNSVPVPFLGTCEPTPPVLTRSRIYTFRIPKEANAGDVWIVEIHRESEYGVRKETPITIDYADICAVPKE
ncbi:MAG: hypothetical protein J6B85_03130 [Lachnospiraceae bacterium]|nr:hypothetical protein [Lachnospiraceae bacterium]